MKSQTINIAKDFSRYPAGRFFEDGPYSGQKFREEILKPALEANKDITLELDGTRGYGSSFLEEAFGGLVRECIEREKVLAIKLVTSDESLIEEITEYITKAKACPQ